MEMCKSPLNHVISLYIFYENTECNSWRLLLKVVVPYLVLAGYTITLKLLNNAPLHKDQCKGQITSMQACCLKLNKAS